MQSFKSMSMNHGRAFEYALYTVLITATIADTAGAEGLAYSVPACFFGLLASEARSAKNLWLTTTYILFTVLLDIIFLAKWTDRGAAVQTFASFALIAKVRERRAEKTKQTRRNIISHAFSRFVTHPPIPSSSSSSSSSSSLSTTFAVFPSSLCAARRGLVRPPSLARVLCRGFRGRGIRSGCELCCGL
jgi:hypothetical protein